MSSSRSRPTRRTPSSRSATTAAACASASRPARAATSSSSAWPRWTTTASAIPSPPPPRRFVTDLGESGHAARPSLKTQQRLASGCFDAEYDVQSTSGTSPPPPEAVYDVLADGAHLPASGGSRSTSTSKTDGRVHATSTSRAACRTTCTRARGRRTPSARTRSRARPTATCAAPGIWTLTRDRDGGTHVRFDWRVHADRKPAQAAHAVPAPRAALRTTTGRSPARSTGSSPTSQHELRWPPDDPGDKGAGAGEGRVHDARLRA